MPPESSLAYWLDARSPAQRRLHVRLQFARDAWREGSEDGTRTLFVPVWTPGSYLIREFARQLGPVQARDLDSGASIPCVKVAKNRYQVQLAGATRRIEVTYTVYAHELTVRTADITSEHAFWNHANVLLWPVGQPELSARLEVAAPAGWQVACALPTTASVDGTFAFLASGLHAAMDAPCLAGDLTALAWEAGGVRHRALFDGLAGVPIPARLGDDLRAISQAAIDVFGVAPYRDYTFQCLFADSGHGGLEHRDSSVLLASRTVLRGGKSYQEFLGLAAHELFHAWNVKRMRPAELWDFDYEVENYTRMLWLAEGFTAYYDDLLCQRAGVLTADEYLAIVARNHTAMQGSIGRLRQSLDEASYDAWIRFYRPDENTRNSTQNYYVNGSLVGLCWDLTIRKSSRGERSLDHFMRSLWQRTFEHDRGYTIDDVRACLLEALGGNESVAAQLLRLVSAPLELQLAPLLEDFGLSMIAKDQDKPYLGVGFKDGGTVIAYVNDDSPASTAGLAPGDEVLAVAGLRVTQDNWSEVFQTVACVGRELPLLITTRGCVRELRTLPCAVPSGACSIAAVADADGATVALRDGWLRRAPAADS